MPSIFGGLAESYLNPSGVGTEIRSRMNRATVNEKAALKPPIRAFLQTNVRRVPMHGGVVELGQ